MKKEGLDNRKMVHFFTSGVTPWVFMQDHFAEFSKVGWDSEVVAGGVDFSDRFASLKVQARSAPYSRSPTFKNILQSLLYTVNAVSRVGRGVIIAHTPIASVYVAVACFFMRKKFIFFCHGLVSHGFRKGISNRALYLVERFVCRAADSVFFVSPSLKSFAVAEGYASSQCSYSLTGSICGVKPGVKVSKPLKKEIALGYLGRISRAKGIFDCIAALEILRNKGVSCRLVVGGAVEDERFLDLIREYPEIDFLGYVDDRQDFFSKIDVLICASAREGFGMSALEASAYGIPVVGYDIVGLRDAVLSDSTGLLVGPGNFAALAEVIVRYLDFPDIYEEHSANAFARAHKEFGHKKIIDEQISLLDELIEGIRP